MELLPEEVLDRPAATLSGGQKRRVAICRALCASSELLILDEPFTGLDAGTKTDVIRYLQKKSAGREVYEITSQSGKFMGYYEPSFLENLDIMPRTRVRYNVGNWTISANTTSWTTTIHSWIKGDKITVNISQNHSGRNYGGYLGLRDNDDGTVGIVNGSYSTNGWVNGTITVGYTGHFNFLIQNASNHSIVYSGNYIY